MQSSRRIVGWTLAVLALVLVALWLFAFDGWSTVTDRESAAEAACGHATALENARLLDEARVQLVRVRDAGPKKGCDAKKRLEALDSKQRERAMHMDEAVTSRAAAFHQRQPAKELERARLAYVAALNVDPYSGGARRALRAVLIARPPPRAQPGAEEACALGQELREAGLLTEARLMYSRARASGRDTACLRDEAEMMRERRAAAYRQLHDARAEAAAGQRDAARDSYVEALRLDASAPGARTALERYSAVDGRWPLWVEDSATWISRSADDVGDFFTGSAVRIGLAAFGLLLVGLLLLWLLMMLCAFRRIRRALAHVPFPLPTRVTRTRVRVTEFSAPEGQDGVSVTGWYTSALAGLRQQDPYFDVYVGDADAGPPLLDAGALAGTPVSAVAQIAEVVARATPRRELRVNGRVMGAGVDGTGLQVELHKRNGRWLAGQTGWEKKLPAATRTGLDTQYELAVRAAQWTRDRL